jgi:hypothetical protein
MKGNSQMFKAALTKAEFDGLGDAEKALYAEKDGHFILQVESVMLENKTLGLEDIAGLKAMVADLKAKNQKKAGQLAVFEGLDAAEAKAAIAKLKEIGDIDTAEVQAIEARVEPKYRKQVQDLRADIVKVTAERDKALEAHGRSYLEAEARRAFAHHKVLPDWQDVLMDKVRVSTRVKPMNGAFTIEVLDMSGNPRISNAQGSTDPMGVVELVSSPRTSKS